MRTHKLYVFSSSAKAMFSCVNLMMNALKVFNSIIMRIFVEVMDIKSISNVASVLPPH